MSPKTRKTRVINEDESIYLGRGVYGCVFSPPIPCDDSQEKPGRRSEYSDNVGKIFNKRIHGDKEYESITDIISLVDPGHLFTNKLLHKCDINHSDYSKTTGFNNCPIQDDTIQLIYQTKGISLDSFISRNISLQSCNEILKQMVPIATGLGSMSRKKVAHLDIKPPNIILSEKRVNLIDFGLSKMFKDVYKKEENMFIFKHKYQYYPPEFTLRHFLFTRNDLIRAGSTIDSSVVAECIEYVRAICLENYSNSGFGDIVEMIEFEKEISNGVKYFLKKISQQKKQGSVSQTDVDNIFSKQIIKIDVFSFGMVLLDIHSRTKKPQKTNKLAGIREIIKKCIHMNPTRRIHPRTMAKQFKLLMNQ